MDGPKSFLSERILNFKIKRPTYMLFVWLLIVFIVFVCFHAHLFVVWLKCISHSSVYGSIAFLLCGLVLALAGSLQITLSKMWWYPEMNLQTGLAPNPLWPWISLPTIIRTNCIHIIFIELCFIDIHFDLGIFIQIFKKDIFIGPFTLNNGFSLCSSIQERLPADFPITYFSDFEEISEYLFKVSFKLYMISYLIVLLILDSLSSIIYGIILIYKIQLLIYFYDDHSLQLL